MTGDPRRALRYDPATGRPIRFPACSDLYLEELRSSYRAAWIGVVLGLV